MCSAPAFYAWRRLPFICWKLLIGVCVRDGLAASVCVYRTSAASVELLYLRVGAPLLSLAGFMFKAARHASFSLFVVASAACVYETGLPLLFAYVVALLLLPFSFFLGVGAPSLSLAGFMF